MSIKKLLIDYTKQTAQAVLEWHKELENAQKLGNEYFKTMYQPNETISQEYIIANRAMPFIDLAYRTRNLSAAEKEAVFKLKNQKMQELNAFLNLNYQQQKSEPIRMYAKLHLWHISENFDYPFLWLYQDAIYGIKGSNTEEEQKLLILEFADGERKKFERLKQKFSDKPTEELKYERVRIPEQVRIEVWRRDQGRCVRCGSRENLEYDHIVPVSKGGSNTARNIELLCESCNRSKGNRIT